MSALRIAVIIPTLNAEHEIPRLLPPLVAALPPEQIWVVDSDSSDDTVPLCREYGVNTYIIKRASFNHSGTRRWARSLVQADILVYMTQDAIPARSDFLEQITKPFSDPRVGIVYGRQLPRPGAGPLEAFPRFFNYPEVSSVKDKEDIPRLGVRTFFCSDSFCAYRATTWDEVGGFPERAIVSEDHYLGKLIILAGYKIAYSAEAAVYHSHNYSLIQEFQRYFDVRVARNQEPPEVKFGKAESEGLRFTQAQLAYLWQSGYSHLIPYALFATFVKFAGYQVGRLEPYLPLECKRLLSQQRYFWQTETKLAPAPVPLTRT